MNTITKTTNIRRRLTALALLSLVLLVSCQSSQRINGEWVYGSDIRLAHRDIACRDSLFLSLKGKPSAQLTAFERSYFEQKFNECYATDNGSPDGSTPEWILAVLAVAEVVVTIIIAVAK